MIFRIIPHGVPETFPFCQFPLGNPSKFPDIPLHSPENSRKFLPGKFSNLSPINPPQKILGHFSHTFPRHFPQTIPSGTSWVSAHKLLLGGAVPPIIDQLWGVAKCPWNLLGNWFINRKHLRTTNTDPMVIEWQGATRSSRTHPPFCAYAVSRCPQYLAVISVANEQVCTHTHTSRARPMDPFWGPFWFHCLSA